ncbi:GIY-YIG nuclease family protein [Nostoc sp. MS1]|uniref:GIY-YIG nuclease family protein n=1 Tax=Nostoc sp. MS1 TaxID=2764711 RepID=UPI001CC44491|nr:GIY-YIG nuclease family protein [Nostoc sp. MS1]BCL40298.1 hypothetical protein NSMS1_67450 [Nostoc sp. MS1]
MSEVNNIEYVYLFNLDGTNRYKIGMTSNTPETRLTSVQYENKAFELKLVHYITVNDARKVEKLLHNFYAKNRVRFEYFDFDNITEVIEKMNSLQYIHDNTLLLSEIEKLKSELEQQKE